MRSQEILELLRKYESRNITAIDPDGTWPIVWERAKGVHVWDAEGRKYLDLTAAFGVAAAGHANPRIVRAGQKQMARLLHAMGDVHPHALKARLAQDLSRITFERWNPKKRATGKTIFCNSGFEAVEAALKTAHLATRKPGVIAFKSGYHGLGYGALNATHRSHFHAPFHAQLRRFGTFVRFPAKIDDLAAAEREIRAAFKRKPIGAILLEPVQVRGGINIPPPEFLPLVRSLAEEYGALLILDEIYTGFGRTGKWFACEHWKTVPDLVCVGKALTGGFPLSACVGRAQIMDDAWPPSSGEAIHTSTFLGHPVGCAMALAQIEVLQSTNLVERSEQLGAWLNQALNEIAVSTPGSSVRCIGLLAGLELTRKSRPAGAEAFEIVKMMLHDGFVILPEGEHSNVVSFSPPLTISQTQLSKAVSALKKALNALGF